MLRSTFGEFIILTWQLLTQQHPGRNSPMEQNSREGEKEMGAKAQRVNPERIFVIFLSFEKLRTCVRSLTFVRAYAVESWIRFRPETKSAYADRRADVGQHEWPAGAAMWVSFYAKPERKCAASRFLRATRLSIGNRARERDGRRDEMRLRNVESSFACFIRQANSKSSNLISICCLFIYSYVDCCIIIIIQREAY